MQLYRYLRVVRAWIWLIIVSVALCAAIGGFVATRLPAMYTSQVRLFSGPPLTGGVVDNADIIVGQALAGSYADLATTLPLLNRVIVATKISINPVDLASDVTTHVPVSSGLLIVTVHFQDPGKAAALANAIATELIDYPPEAPRPKPASNVSLVVIDPAIPPTEADSPRPLYSAALGGGIGFLLAVSFAFVIENLRGPGEDSQEPR